LDEQIVMEWNKFPCYPRVQRSGITQVIDRAAPRKAEIHMKVLIPFLSFVRPSLYRERAKGRSLRQSKTVNL
jgi:hypothetical protein